MVLLELLCVFLCVDRCLTDALLGVMSGEIRFTIERSRGGHSDHISSLTLPPSPLISVSPWQHEVEVAIHSFHSLDLLGYRYALPIGVERWARGVYYVLMTSSCCSSVVMDLCAQLLPLPKVLLGILCLIKCVWSIQLDVSLSKFTQTSKQHYVTSSHDCVCGALAVSYTHQTLHKNREV